MKLIELSAAARDGQPVYLPDMRNALLADDHQTITGALTLPDGQRVHRFEIPIPAPLSGDSLLIVERYVAAEIYNRLASVGGTGLSLSAPDATSRDLVGRVAALFEIERGRAERTGYGRIVNMLDRMLSALHPESSDRGFVIHIAEAGETVDLPDVSFRAEPSSVFTDVTGGLEGLLVCGLDIGGTDIKAVLAEDGRLVALKEYDWNPGAYGNVEEIIDPMLSIIRLMALCAELRSRPARPDIQAAVDDALDPAGTLAEIDEALGQAEGQGYLRQPVLDAIGLCFPDVVVRNRIVGGEVPKTRAMRSNASRDFEEQFGKLTAVNDSMEALTKRGVVMNTNDGPMAAFTAAVELAASGDTNVRHGVFAHTLGTDLGSGLALADATIPEIPLELYNLIIDIGSDPDRRLDPSDLRSIANTNTGLSGTPQKIASQAAAFRFSDQLGGPSLLSEIAQSGDGFVEEVNGLRSVPESPEDRRKPYLAWLMDRAASDDAIAEAFRRIGEVVAIVAGETEHIMDTGLDQRYLFGRFVKVPHVFDLLVDGARRRSASLELVAVNESLAFTPLMKGLAANEHYTVAQFGQAVGAVYLANLGLQRGE